MELSGGVSLQDQHTSDHLLSPDRQTSPASGNVIQMGKGYVQWQEAAGTDLGSHFESAFARIVGYWAKLE